MRVCFHGNGRGGSVWILIQPSRMSGDGTRQRVPGNPKGWEFSGEPQGHGPDWSLCRENTLELQYCWHHFTRKNIRAIFWRLESFQKKTTTLLSFLPFPFLLDMWRFGWKLAVEHTLSFFTRIMCQFFVAMLFLLEAEMLCTRAPPDCTEKGLCSHPCFQFYIIYKERLKPCWLPCSHWS